MGVKTRRKGPDKVQYRQASNADGYDRILPSPAYINMKVPFIFANGIPND